MASQALSRFETNLEHEYTMGRGRFDASNKWQEAYLSRKAGQANRLGDFCPARTGFRVGGAQTRVSAVSACFICRLY
jgi:hypothetical protein